jgi:predicted nucleic acid-binding protein
MSWILDSSVHVDRATGENRRVARYDASYLALALRLHLPLATLDQALRVAAQACGLLLP